MKPFVLISPGEACTLLLAQKTGELLEPGDVLALWGDLGAGKTLFAQGVARGLEVDAGGPVTSPTYTLINEYAGRLYLYHIDLYRLSGPEELDTLPWREALYGAGAAVVEWPGRLGRFLPSARWDVRLTVTGDESRRIAIEPRGRRNHARAQNWWKELERGAQEDACT